MTRVCIDEYPLGSSKGQKKPGFYLDPTLKSQIDVMLKNVADDWDFTIIISGGGEVRVGKSVLAMQIGAYWTQQIKELYGVKVPFNVKTNFIFDGRELIKKGNYLGEKYPLSSLVFDEAGADLEGKKVMQTLTQDVLDFYRECGQYNLLNILVLPDFFTLPVSIALTRSIFLLDVYYNTSAEGKFERGYSHFFSKRNKKHLYIKGKKDLNYHAYPPNFRVRFHKFYPVNETVYRQAKIDALRRRESKRRNKFQIQRDACWFLMHKEIGWTQEEIGQRMENLTGIFVPQNTVSDGVRHFLIDGNR